MSMLPQYKARQVQTVTAAAKTLAAATDAGFVQNYVTATAGTTGVFTLPAVAAGNVGLSFTVRAGNNNGDGPVTVTPNAADGVNGLGFTSATGKGPQVLAAVVQAGDEITLQSSGVTGVNAWYITNAVGSWTRLP
ncbi:MAG: hypothetical protein WCJ60_02355 [bacterium]